MSLRSPRCALCGRYVSNVTAVCSVNGGIEYVRGKCSRCGRVEAVIEFGWAWEDFLWKYPA